MVVPTLAPRITGIAWLRFMTPDEMNPTTNTVVTEDDWMTAVTPAPDNAPTNRLLRHPAEGVAAYRAARNDPQRLGHRVHPEQEDRQAAEQAGDHDEPVDRAGGLSDYIDERHRSQDRPDHVSTIVNWRNPGPNVPTKPTLCP